MANKLDVQINLNSSFINDIIQIGFIATVDQLQEIIDIIIQYPGYFPEFPDSDIVDTGELFRQQGMVVKGLGQAEYNFGTDYGIYVHEGYTLRNGKRQPGRPWFNQALQEFDFAAELQKNIISLLDS